MQLTDPNFRAAFARFWRAYPRRRAIGAAAKALAKALETTPLSTILNALDAQRKAGMLDHVAYLPYPATWLNARQWEDEVVAGTDKSAVTRLAAAWRAACRAGDEGAKRAVRQSAISGAIDWSDVEAEIARLIKEDITHA